MFYLEADIKYPINYIFCGKFTAVSTWRHQKFNHTIHEILICTKGVIYIQQDDRKYELHPGDGIFLLAGHTHQGYADSAKGTRAYWVQFSMEEENFRLLSQAMLQKTLRKYWIHQQLTQFNDTIFFPEVIYGLNMEKISVLFNQLLHLSKANYYTKQSINYCMTSFFIEITQQVLNHFSKEYHFEHGNRNINEIISWIEHSAHNKISLTDVAEAFNYSKNYLSKYFKENTGITVQNYINQCKINAAKGLLINTDKSIKQIAYELGFTDEKYFMRLFHNLEATTPKKFRNAYYLTNMNS